MPGAMGAIGNIFKSPATGPVLSGATLGLGELGNLLAGRAQSKEADTLKAQQDKIANLTPAQLTQMVESAKAPIDNGLVQTINNSVQGDMAQRGLAQAPGIFAASEAQALAPIEQQNYSTALQQVMKQLGLPLEYASTIKQFMPNQQNLTPAMTLLLQQLAKLKGTNAGTGGAGTGSTSSGASLPGLSQLPGIISDAPTPDLGNIDLSQLGVTA